MNFFDKKKFRIIYHVFMFTRITLKERHNVPMLWNMIIDRLHLWQLYHVSLRHGNEMNFCEFVIQKCWSSSMFAYFTICITEIYISSPHITSTTKTE